MKSGTNGSVGGLKTVAAPHHTVRDTYKQCPGDKFTFACDPKNTFTSFDIKTGVASIKAPRSNVDIAMSCKLTKYALNKQVETKYFKFKILAMPKSQCKINVAQILKSMKAGDKGAVSIAMTMGSTNSCNNMKGYIKKCKIDNKRWYGSS
jgi:hypothetical protein